MPRIFRQCRHFMFTQAFQNLSIEYIYIEQFVCVSTRNIKKKILLIHIMVWFSISLNFSRGAADIIIANTNKTDHCLIHCGLHSLTDCLGFRFFFPPPQPWIFSRLYVGWQNWWLFIASILWSEIIKLFAYVYACVRTRVCVVCLQRSKLWCVWTGVGMKKLI